MCSFGFVLNFRTDISWKFHRFIKQKKTLKLWRMQLYFVGVSLLCVCVHVVATSFLQEFQWLGWQQQTTGDMLSSRDLVYQPLENPATALARSVPKILLGVLISSNRKPIVRTYEIDASENVKLKRDFQVHLMVHPHLSPTQQPSAAGISIRNASWIPEQFTIIYISE